MKIAATKIADLWRRLCKSRLGNVTIIFAFTLPVILIAAGGAIDYSQALTVRSQLRDATDAAAVGAVATNSAGYNYAAATSINGEVAPGEASAKLLFDQNIANMQNRGAFTNVTRTVTVTKNVLNLTANVSATATYNTFLLTFIGINSIQLTATSSASNATPGWMDFYLLLDVSGSMGLPSTNSEQTRLAAVNDDDKLQYPNGCTLACHFAPIGSTITHGYDLSRNGGNLGCVKNYVPASCPKPVSNCPTAGTSACIQLRLDAVGYAVTQLLSTANTSATLTDQYRVGLYPFIVHADTTYFPLTKNINGSATVSTTINYAAANLATELDTGINSKLGSGGTHFDNALPDVGAVIINNGVGTGASPTNTLPWIFFVTDGSQDNQTYTSSTNKWAGSNHAVPLDASACTTLRSKGIQIAVLYIPYEKIQNPNPSFANDEDDYANNNIPNIPAPLQACATPGFYFTANTPADINTALTTMFKQAIASDRLTL